MPLTYRTAGESHGPALIAVLEGLPSGLTLRREDIDDDLARRQLGFGRRFGPDCMVDVVGGDDEAGPALLRHSHLPRTEFDVVPFQFRDM